jgi:hypothetical protein
MTGAEFVDFGYKGVLAVGVLVGIVVSLRNANKIQTVHLLINSGLAKEREQAAELSNSRAETSFQLGKQEERVEARDRQTAADAIADQSTRSPNT